MHHLSEIRCLNLPSIGEVVEADVIDLDEKGRGIALIGGKELLLYFAVPGDSIRARIIARRRRKLIGELVELTSPSSHRITPRCKLFGKCGGCKLQNIDYTYQLLLKRRLVKKLFKELIWRLKSRKSIHPIQFGSIEIEWTMLSGKTLK